MEVAAIGAGDGFASGIAAARALYMREVARLRRERLWRAVSGEVPTARQREKPVLTRVVHTG